MSRPPSFSLQDIRRRRRAAARKKISLALLAGACHVANLVLWIGLAVAVAFAVWLSPTPLAMFFSFAGLIAFGWVWIQLDNARSALARSTLAAIGRNNSQLLGLDEQCRSRAAEQLALDEAKALGLAAGRTAKADPARRI